MPIFRFFTILHSERVSSCNLWTVFKDIGRDRSAEITFNISKRRCILKGNSLSPVLGVERVPPSTEREVGLFSVPGILRLSFEPDRRCWLVCSTCDWKLCETSKTSLSTDPSEDLDPDNSGCPSSSAGLLLLTLLSLLLLIISFSFSTLFRRS